MATTVSALTQEQIQEGTQMLIGVQKALLPAKLKNLHSNGYIIVHEVVKRGLPVSVDSAMKVVKAILFENKLEWDVEPAALTAKKANIAPAKLESSQKFHEHRAKTVKDAEIADAYAKEQEEFEAVCYSLVDSFLPMNRRGSIDYKKMGEVQTQLKDHIKKEKTRGCSMKAVHAILAAEIQKQYEAIERANERL